MRCLHINFQRAFIILLSFFLNAIPNGHMALNHMDNTPEDKTQKTPINSAVDTIKPVTTDVILSCPSQMQCNDLPVECMNCALNFSCIYGETLQSLCEIKSGVSCVGNKKFKKEYLCRYCYQTEPWEHKCKLQGNCNSVASPRMTYRTNCTVDNNLLCLGRRTFFKNVKCNWTGGHKWSTALALSITLGGFGADRFYLGHWQEGIGKLFSFGGLGVWTIIDVILISLHYLGPADGSLYI